MADEVQEVDINKNVQDPKSVYSDGTKVEQHSIPDQIAADNHLAARRRAKAGALPFRQINCILPGAN
jgi:hypothetical protein